MSQKIEHIKHPLKHRNLTVSKKYHLTPNMMRIIFTGEDLSDFISLSPDDNVKIFLTNEAGEKERRSYTPRHFDADKQELAIDFAVHKTGAVTKWAVGAQVGDALEVAGPKKSVVASGFDWWLLVGDETALPSIARRLEELPENTNVITICGVENKDEKIEFETKANHTSLWLYRPYDEVDDVEQMLSAVKGITFPKGDGFIWISAEAKIARSLREYVIKECGHPAEWVKSTAYWVKGESATSMRIDDEIN